MNFVRSLMTLFLLCVLSLSVAGWIWAGGLESQKLMGARFALGLSSLMAVGAIWLLWKEKPIEQ